MRRVYQPFPQVKWLYFKQPRHVSMRSGVSRERLFYFLYIAGLSSHKGCSFAPRFQTAKKRPLGLLENPRRAMYRFTPKSQPQDFACPYCERFLFRKLNTWVVLEGPGQSRWWSEEELPRGPWQGIRMRLRSILKAAKTRKEKLADQAGVECFSVFWYRNIRDEQSFVMFCSSVVNQNWEVLDVLPFPVMTLT